MVYALRVRDWDAIYSGLYVLISILIVAAIVGGIIFGRKIYLERKKRQAENPKPRERKAPVLAIVACCLLGVFILSQLGNTVELAGGNLLSPIVGYTIGVLSLAIAALVLMIVDTVKRMR